MASAVLHAIFGRARSGLNWSRSFASLRLSDIWVMETTIFITADCKSIPLPVSEPAFRLGDDDARRASTGGRSPSLRSLCLPHFSKR